MLFAQSGTELECQPPDDTTDFAMKMLSALRESFRV